MAAIDSCEPQVIRALQKDGWQILYKPHSIRLSNRQVFADFSVWRIEGNHTVEAVILEVKCFTDATDDLENFYTAVVNMSSIEPF